MRRFIIAAALLACSATSNAVPVLHDIIFTPSLVNGGRAGVGTLTWDSETYTLSNVTWDFGEGRTGGMTEFVFGLPMDAEYTWGAYMFEQMTGVDLLPHPEFHTFSIGAIHGTFPTAVIRLGYGGPGTYELVNMPFEFVGNGTLTVRARGVPEPGTWALLAAGLAGVLLARRRVATSR